MPPPRGNQENREETSSPHRVVTKDTAKEKGSPVQTTEKESISLLKPLDFEYLAGIKVGPSSANAPLSEDFSP